MSKERARDEYHREATSLFNKGSQAAAEGGESQTLLSTLTRGKRIRRLSVRWTHEPCKGILNMSSGQWEDASRTFDSVVAEKPTNLIALLGKVMHVILYSNTAV